MAVLDDIIAQQLSQYPGGPTSPVRALLPQSQADLYTGGLRPADPTLANVPTAGEEALQPSDIPAQWVQKSMGPGFRRQYGQQYGDLVTNVVASIAPLMLGMVGGGEEGEELAGALRGPARATASLGDEYTWTPRQRAALISAGFRHPERNYPELAHEVYAVSPRTTPDLSLVEQPGRYHGSKGGPIAMVSSPETASHPGNLLGKALYTTDNPEIAESYGIPYRIYEVDPEKLKFLDANNEKLPPGVLDRVTELLPPFIRDRSAPNGVQAIKSRWLLNRNALAKQNAYQVFKRFSDQSPLSNEISKALRQAMEDEGYAGIMHLGGEITGGVRHNVKLYFNPVRDIRPRVMPSREWIPRHEMIRDVPVPGAPPGTPMGFRFGSLAHQRVPAPISGGGSGFRRPQ